MKKPILFLFVIALSACATGQQVHNSLDNQMTQEDLAMNRIYPMAESQCGFKKGAKLNKKAIVQERTCINHLVDQHLMPVAAFPDLVKDMQRKTLGIAEAYASGKISEKQYHEQMKIASDSYDTAWVNAANQKIIAADRQNKNAKVWAQALSAGAQNYNADIQRQRANTESQRPSSPMKVQCRESLGKVYCEEY